MKLPSGNCHIFMLSGDALANVNLLKNRSKKITPFHSYSNNIYLRKGWSGERQIMVISDCMAKRDCWAIVESTQIQCLNYWTWFLFDSCLCDSVTTFFCSCNCQLPIAIYPFNLLWNSCIQKMLKNKKNINTYEFGLSTTALTLFLWFVNVTFVFPAAKSHSLIVQSWLPVIIYKILQNIRQ